MIPLLADTYTIFLREMLRYRRNPSYWVGQLLFPLLVIAFIGFGLNDVVTLPTGISYLGHVAAGVLALVVASGAVGAGFALIEDRESGFLRVLAVAPLATGSVVLGKILARILVSLGLTVLLLLIFTIFTPLRLIHPIAAVFSVVTITSNFVALGISLAGRFRGLESFRMFSAAVTVPIYLLSGMLYPVSTLPPPTQFLAYLNPFTYGVDLLRYALSGVSEVPPVWSITVLLVLTVVAICFAMMVFQTRSRT